LGWLTGDKRADGEEDFSLSSLDLMAEKFAALSVSLYESWDTLRSSMEPLTEDGGIIKQVVNTGTFRNVNLRLGLIRRIGLFVMP
jgi:hypothetical protein